MSERNDSPGLRIGIVHPDLGIGGAERLIVDAAVELASHGHNVTIFTSHHDKNRCFEETIKGPFHVKVHGSFLPRHIFHRFHAICAYIRCIFVAFCMLFFCKHFDVIIADQVSAVIPVIKLKNSTKVIFYCHFPDLLLARRSSFLRKLYRKPIDMIEEATTGMADLILVNSRFTASIFADTFSRLHSRGVVPEILYPAVDFKNFDGPCSYKYYLGIYILKSSTLQGKFISLVYLGRMNFLSINRFERKKNIELAISSFAMLRSCDQVGPSEFDFSQLTLTVAGGYDPRLPENVEYLEELKKLAEREGISDQVKFLTSCPTSERNALLSECLCVIYTPKDEHFGIVPLEAMAARKPVIACNSGGPKETVKDGVTGFLCSPTAVEFSMAMLKFVINAELAPSMGEAARLHVSHEFSTKVFGEQLNSYVYNVYGKKLR